MYKLNRVLAALAIVLASLLSMNAAVAQQQHVWKAADGVYRYGPGNGYFSMFVVTSEGVIAIEPVNAQHSRGFVQAIRSVTDKPIRYLLHSHNHWDHSKGGQVFRDQGAKIVAHVEAFEWMKANPHPELALPDESWAGNRKEFVLGGRTIELHYLGMSHGLGMTVFLLPKEKIAYIADIVTPNRVLMSIVPDFNIKEWQRTLRQVEALDFQSAIFSHTHAMDPFGSKSDVVAVREFIEDLQAAITAEFKKGTPFASIPSAVKLPKYEHWAMYREWLPMNVWRVMLDMHMGPYPWRPEHAYEGSR
ncbi:MBL fold metallo-hydrolase [Piscinibacter sakaiensis]|uniref:MBL fold metallo-hydrolase n=1 Tax=Piscinibacter sakaiensis TaxID=1547922 RepID=UPI003AAA7DC8